MTNIDIELKQSKEFLLFCIVVISAKWFDLHLVCDWRYINVIWIILFFLQQPSKILQIFIEHFYTNNSWKSVFRLVLMQTKHYFWFHKNIWIKFQHTSLPAKNLRPIIPLCSRSTYSSTHRPFNISLVRHYGWLFFMVSAINPWIRYLVTVMFGQIFFCLVIIIKFVLFFCLIIAGSCLPSTNARLWFVSRSSSSSCSSKCVLFWKVEWPFLQKIFNWLQIVLMSYFFMWT